MERKNINTLGKRERLKSRKAIEQLFAAGRSFSLFPFRVTWHLQSGESKPALLQTAFSVSKRHFKKATQRNRIKRLMREAYRVQKNELKQTAEEKQQPLSVFILYTGNELPDYKDIFSKMGAVIRRLQKTVNEETAAHT